MDKWNEAAHAIAHKVASEMKERAGINASISFIFGLALQIEIDKEYSIENAVEKVHEVKAEMIKRAEYMGYRMAYYPAFEAALESFKGDFITYLYVDENDQAENMANQVVDRFSDMAALVALTKTFQKMSLQCNAVEIASRAIVKFDLEFPHREKLGNG